MTSGKTNLVMTVIGFVVSTLFIVFICTRLICARIQLRNSRRNFRRHIASRSNLSSMEGGMNGVQPSISINFPAKKYGDEYFSSAESGQCSICLAEYHKEDVVRILPYCGHYFHMRCIDLWFLQHCTCPVCRLSLREANEKKRSMQFMSSSRSQLNTDLPTHPHHCRFMSTTPETHGTDLVQENQLLCQVTLEANRDNMTQLTIENGPIKKPQKQACREPIMCLAAALVYLHLVQPNLLDEKLGGVANQVGKYAGKFLVLGACFSPFTGRSFVHIFSLLM